MVKTIIENENRIYSLLALLKEIINYTCKNGKITYSELVKKYQLDIMEHDINVFLKGTIFDEEIKVGEEKC